MTPEMLPGDKLPGFPPTWAEEFGEDRYGLFCTFHLKHVAFHWRWIPPGTFRMGSPGEEEGRFDDEGPQHAVTLSQGFWLGATPVTQAQWQDVTGENPSHFKGKAKPVETVDWETANGFGRRLSEIRPGFSACLPSEAQWEYACRAGTTGEVAGTELSALAWYADNAEGETHDVAQKEANAWGLYDMRGNVLEWCRDGMRDYQHLAVQDPFGPMEDSISRVVRGGSWGLPAWDCRAAVRFERHPGLRFHFLGLRLAAGQSPEAGNRIPAERE